MGKAGIDRRVREPLRSPIIRCSEQYQGDAMQLISFQVKDFRSVNDSTPIRVEVERAIDDDTDVNGRTILVGRNESGKSSLLRALHSLNPPSRALKAWGLARDFPRGRKRSAFRDDIVMLETTWKLNATEQRMVGQLFPRSAGVEEVQVSRTYAAKRKVSLPIFKTLADTAAPAVGVSAALNAELAEACDGVAEASAIKPLLATLTSALNAPVSAATWATVVAEAMVPLQAAIAAVPAVAQAGAENLRVIESTAKAITDDAGNYWKAIAWIESQLPVFVYLEDWDFVPGQYNIREYLKRVPDAAKHTKDDPLFAKLMKVAELDATELQNLLETQYEERTLLTDRAGNVVTETLSGLWKDRKIAVQFRVDGDHFDVIVKDGDSDALVPLDERSRGFRWYFSFFVSYAADTQGGELGNAILLLDEPGLFLHALAQEALLSFFRTLPNQIVYTTHSPFMVEPAELTAVRTVNLTRVGGTVVSADPTGDANTLFPLQAALGYSLTQTLFVGTESVVVEGVTDYWYLTAASDFLKDSDAGLLAEIVLTPAGGAGKVGYMVALLCAQRLNVVVLLDSDGAGDDAVSDLLRSKLARSESIVRVGSSAAPGSTEADIEDLLDPAVFESLAREVYKRELKGKTLALNEKIPRIVPRFEQAFEAAGLAFNKTRVAKAFLQRMGTDAAAVLTAPSQDRFKNLIARLNEASKKIKAAGRKPFTT
jgi:energy-coupling factor transporter ATP-binding protein EcfA2